MTNGIRSETNGTTCAENALMPCPFCGGEARLVEESGIAFGWCPMCNVRTRASTDERVAAERWNTRAEDAESEMAQRIQSLELECAKLQDELNATLGEREDRAEAFTLLTNGTVCVGSKQLVARIAELQSRLNKVALGGRKLTAEQVRECAEKVYLEGYSDGSVNRGAHIEETDWQAIADDLNKALGVGECEFVGDAKCPPKCSACGWRADIYDCEWLEDGEFEYDGKFCKQCGAKVKAVKR